MSSISLAPILVGCEFSQAVTKAFRDRGFEAYSCDLIETEGNSEWHLQMDIFEAIKKIKPRLAILFPPCTYLTLAGNRWFLPQYKERYPNRKQQRAEAISFVKQLWECDVPRIAIENPLGVLSTEWMPPTQIIQPYWFGDKARKTTCLWLKNLPKLRPSNMVEPEIIQYKNGKGTDSAWHINTFNLPKTLRSKERSRTFPGVAVAMAEQWGNYKPIQTELCIL